jgi:hydrogenase-1 operon protein HyaF
MSRPFPIPVVALGPGSQPVDEPLQYIVSPGEMPVFRPPVPREGASAAAIAGAKRLLTELVSRMESEGFPAGTRLSLLGLDAATVGQVNELLGLGEVSAVIRTDPAVDVQESAFAGVWRVQSLDERGVVVRDDVEAGPMAQVVLDALASAAARRPALAPATPHETSLMNGPAVLHELQQVAAGYRDGDEPHVVNFTLLPVTPEDLEYIDAHLGRGPVTILSRGYGNCRITATALPRVWWVQYFNSMDKLILNTIEVVTVPAVALAGAEDFTDSVVRLRQCLEAF